MNGVVVRETAYLLGQAPQAPVARRDTAFDGLLWLGGVVVVVLVGVVVAAYYRRRFRARPEADGIPFTLDQLRRLHAGGELTDAEFDLLKKATMDRWRQIASDTPSASPHNVLQQDLHG